MRSGVRRLMLGALVCALLGVAAAPAPAAAPPWPASWQAGASAPAGEGRFPATATVVDGKLYSFGGFHNAAFQVSRVYTRYDPAANTWTVLGTLPPGMVETHSGVAHDDRFIYFAGGFGGDLQVSQGQTSQTPSAAVWRYDTQTNTWLQITSLPVAGGSGGLALVGRKLHSFGGVGADKQTNRADHYVYDLDSSLWTTAAPTPDAKDHFGTVVIDGKIYAVGGEHGHDVLRAAQSTAHVYDPATDRWTALARMPLAKSHVESATFVSEGQIIVAGGQIPPSGPTDDVAAYDPAADRWTSLPRLPGRRQAAIVQRLGDQIVFALGGIATNQPQTSTLLGRLPTAVTVDQLPGDPLAQPGVPAPGGTTSSPGPSVPGTAGPSPSDGGSSCRTLSVRWTVSGQRRLRTVTVWLGSERVASLRGNRTRVTIRTRTRLTGRTLHVRGTTSTHRRYAASRKLTSCSGTVPSLRLRLRR
jgi:N-acetylneuraminic acid mutarotase